MQIPVPLTVYFQRISHTTSQAALEMFYRVALFALTDTKNRPPVFSSEWATDTYKF